MAIHRMVIAMSVLKENLGLSAGSFLETLHAMPTQLQVLGDVDNQLGIPQRLLHIVVKQLMHVGTANELRSQPQFLRGLVIETRIELLGQSQKSTQDEDRTG